MSAGTSRTTAPPDVRSGLKIVDVEAMRLRLPYKQAVTFVGSSEAAGEYVVLRLTTDDGTVGLAESVVRFDHHGEDATAFARTLETHFKPQLVGQDPLAHLRILASLGRRPERAAAIALIDNALWDLRGKLYGQPVWRLLGGARPEPVPLSWIAHGRDRAAQLAEAAAMVGTRGYRGLKLKTWRRSAEDVRLVADARKQLGDGVLIYADCNGTYSETQARNILPRMADSQLAFIEDPCDIADPRRLADLVAALPAPLLGDKMCDRLESDHVLVALRAVAAVSVKLRRTGLSEALKIIALCEGAGLPVVIGTDSESRIGAMARLHLWAAVPHLAPYPTETHFFDKLADDAFAGEWGFKDGAILPSDAPGFGAGLDPARLERFRF